MERAAKQLAERKVRGMKAELTMLRRLLTLAELVYNESEEERLAAEERHY